MENTSLLHATPQLAARGPVRHIRRRLRTDVLLQLCDCTFVVRDDVVHDVANGNHAKYSVAIHYRKVTDFLLAHEHHAVVGGRGGIDRNHVGGHDLSHCRFLGVAPLQRDFSRVVALRENPRQAIAVNYQQGASTELRELFDGGIHRCVRSDLPECSVVHPEKFPDSFHGDPGVRDVGQFGWRGSPVANLSPIVADR